MKTLVIVILISQFFLFGQKLSFTPLSEVMISDTVELRENNNRFANLLDSFVISYTSKKIIYERFFDHIQTSSGFSKSIISDTRMRKGVTFYLSCITSIKSSSDHGNMINTLQYDSFQTAYLLDNLLRTEDSLFLIELGRLSSVEDSIYKLLKSVLNLNRGTLKLVHSFFRTEDIFLHLAKVEGFNSFRFGYKYYLESDYFYANKEFKSFMNFFPEEGFVQKLKCKSLAFLGNYKEAIPEIYNVFKDEKNILYYIGQSYLRAELPVRALSKFKELLKLDKNNLRALHGLGHCYFLLNVLDSSKYYWHLSLKKDSNNSLLIGNLASLYKAWGDTVTAQNLVRKALEIRTDPFDLYELGFKDLANKIAPNLKNNINPNYIFHYSKQYPKGFSIYKEIAYYYDKFEDYPRAIIYCDSALSLPADSGDILTVLQIKAYALHLTGKNKTALPIYLNLIDKNPNNKAYNHYAISGIYNAKNDKWKALSYAMMAHRLDSLNIDYLERLAWCYTYLKRDSAELLWNKITLLEPDNSDAFCRLGEINLKRHDFEKFCFYMEQCLSLDPLNLDALLLYGKELVKKSHHEKGLFYIKKAALLGDSWAKNYVKKY